MNAQEHTIETLSSMPIWKLVDFCRAYRVSLVIERGKITEIIGGSE